MGEHNRPAYCVWCRDTHGRKLLCDAAAAVLTAAAERGQSGTMPTVSFDAPVEMTPDPAADLLISQLVIKGAVIPGPGGIVHPTLVFTGRDARGRTLPQWFYLSDDVNLRLAAPLVHDMAELAIRQANTQNRG